jgi:glycosyltransferase involved in cell wall biosynthesis
MLVSKELGGAGFIALQLAAALRERVPESFVWIPGEGPAATKAKEMGVACYQYDPAQAFTPSKIQFALCNWKVGRLLRSHRPGLIHVHSPVFYGALSLGFKISQLKSIVHVHLEEEKEGLRWALKKPPDVIITCARFLVEHVRSILPEHCQRTQSIVAIPNAVDTSRFQPGDKRAAKLQVGAPPHIPLVLMAANLAPHKGQATALRAAAILKEKGVIAHFWFAGVERGGGKEYSAHLQTLACDLGVADQLQFLGHRRDIPDLLRAADCFVLPSTMEGLPLSILEAQASGTPVIAAPTAGIPEVVIDGKTGFLVAADNAAGYAQHLFYLLQNQALYTHITDDAYAIAVREYSWKTYIERVWGVYQMLMQN